MKQLPKITILTASYNAAATIEQTIVSVVYQDYPNLEYIIIDGGSTDGTIDILKKYEKDGLRWISEPERWLYDALNKGVGMASGEYIEVLGGDDALTDYHVISRVVQKMKPNIDIFAGGVWSVDEKSGTQYEFINYALLNGGEYFGDMPPHAAIFARIELLLKYPFDRRYKIAADAKFFLQCYFDKTVHIQYSDELIAYFANAGISSDENACAEEYNRIYHEMELPFHSPNDAYASSFKVAVKTCLKRIGLFSLCKAIWSPVARIYRVRYKWQKHQCTNEICRWCRRTGSK